MSLPPGKTAELPRRGTTVSAKLEWRRTRKVLDLYALYVDDRGRQGVCYYRRRGSLRKPPYICLASDERRGRENIDVSRPEAFRYILVCAYSAFENGTGSFYSFAAYAEVDDHAGSLVRAPLYHRNKLSYWVAIALIDLTDPDTISIRHVEQYSMEGSERRPVLHEDGRIDMDAGPIEFKSGRP